MPPWKPAPGDGDFVGERRLTERHIATIQARVRQRAVEGEPSGPAATADLEQRMAAR